MSAIKNDVLAPHNCALWCKTCQHCATRRVRLLVPVKPEPIMLLILPIMPSRISHNFYPLFLFYSHVSTYSTAHF